MITSMLDFVSGPKPIIASVWRALQNKPRVWSALQTQTLSLERAPNSNPEFGAHSKLNLEFGAFCKLKKMRAECFFQFKQPLCTHIFSQKNLVHAYFFEFGVSSKLTPNSFPFWQAHACRSFLVELHKKTIIPENSPVQVLSLEESSNLTLTLEFSKFATKIIFFRR